MMDEKQREKIKPPPATHGMPRGRKEDFWSPKELALEGRVSLRTIRRWIKKGCIPYFQPAGPGTTVLIPKCRLRLDMLPGDFLDRK